MTQGCPTRGPSSKASTTFQYHQAGDQPLIHGILGRTFQTQTIANAQIWSLCPRLMILYSVAPFPQALPRPCFWWLASFMPCTYVLMPRTCGLCTHTCPTHLDIFAPCQILPDFPQQRNLIISPLTSKTFLFWSYCGFLQVPIILGYIVFLPPNLYVWIIIPSASGYILCRARIFAKITKKN